MALGFFRRLLNRKKKVSVTGLGVLSKTYKSPIPLPGEANRFFHSATILDRIKALNNPDIVFIQTRAATETTPAEIVPFFHHELAAHGADIQKLHLVDGQKFRENLTSPLLAA